MKKVILQQRAERDLLASMPYQHRTAVSEAKSLLESGLIKLITGPRRAGKSVFAMQLLAGQNYAYLNFDDNTLLSRFDEDAVMKALDEVYPGYKFLLLDEIQNLDGWDTWVTKLYRRGINLVITGSNARLLSSEMGTLLTGRYVETLILPFSMPETLAYTQDTDLPRAMDDYLKNGGFPEIIKNRQLEATYLGTLFDSIILKDVAKRHKIRKTVELYDLADYLITNYSNPVSFNSIADSLSLGSVTTVKRFCRYLEEPYLFWLLPRFNRKLKEMKKANRKVYVVDTGFVSARSLELSANRGRQLENMVFIELIRRGHNLPKKELFYYQTASGKEIDFVIKKGTSIQELIQVSYEISHPKTRKRELDALAAAADELNCDKLTLITWDTDEAILHKGKDILIISARNWFLES